MLCATPTMFDRVRRGIFSMAGMAILTRLRMGYTFDFDGIPTPLLRIRILGSNSLVLFLFPEGLILSVRWKPDLLQRLAFQQFERRCGLTFPRRMMRRTSSERGAGTNASGASLPQEQNCSSSHAGRQHYDTVVGRSVRDAQARDSVNVIFGVMCARKAGNAIGPARHARPAQDPCLKCCPLPAGLRWRGCERQQSA